MYFLSDAFPFFVARKETDHEAYCSSLSNKELKLLTLTLIVAQCMLLAVVIRFAVRLRSLVDSSE